MTVALYFPLKQNYKVGINATCRTRRRGQSFRKNEAELMSLFDSSVIVEALMTAYEAIARSCGGANWGPRAGRSVLRASCATAARRRRDGGGRLTAHTN